MSKKYIIISPVRDEEKYIEKTISSVVNQVIKPSKWIFVNDGSTDNTSKSIIQVKKQYDWIDVITRDDRGFRQPGKGIIEAFYEGFDKVKNLSWDFIVKLDCDLSFESTYFESILGEFAKNPSLGIASGKTYIPINGNIDNLKLEWSPDTCTRGPCKMYRRQCF